MFEESQENLSAIENEIINSIIVQYKPPDEKPVQEDISKITYNDYFKNQGINYIKRNMSLNDPLLDPVFEAMAANIKTPLEEWDDRFGKNEANEKLRCYEFNINL
jgi:hypothetical protein